jgi:putative Holliday junction resolvase
VGGSPETILAFDFGTRRIGVALGNSLTDSARPLEVIEAQTADARFARVAALIAQWQPQRLVVGRPCHPDGAPHEMTLRCERFARQLHGRFGLPVASVDERYSSAVSREGLRPGEPDDALAAATILRQYLDEQRNA